MDTTNKLLDSIINDNDISINNSNIIYIEYFKTYLRYLVNDINLSKNIQDNQTSINKFLEDISYNDINNIKNSDINNNDKYSAINDIEFLKNTDKDKDKYIDNQCRQNIRKFAIISNNKKKILPKKK